MVSAITRASSGASFECVFMLIVPSAPTTVTVLWSLREAALDVERLPRTRVLVLRAAEGVFRRLAVRRAIHVAGQRAADVLQHEAHRAPDRRVRPAPWPRQLKPAFMSSVFAIGPLTMTHTATGLVVACMPWRLNAGSATASVAAISTGRYSGSQPAITQLIAMRSTVAAPYPGATFATTS